MCFTIGRTFVHENCGKYKAKGMLSNILFIKFPCHMLPSILTVFVMPIISSLPSVKLLLKLSECLHDCCHLGAGASLCPRPRCSGSWCRQCRGDGLHSSASPAQCRPSPATRLISPQSRQRRRAEQQHCATLRHQVTWTEAPHDLQLSWLGISQKFLAKQFKNYRQIWFC